MFNNVLTICSSVHFEIILLVYQSIEVAHSSCVVMSFLAKHVFKKLAVFFFM